MQKNFVGTPETSHFQVWGLEKSLEDRVEFECKPQEGLPNWVLNLMLYSCPKRIFQSPTSEVLVNMVNPIDLLSCNHV